MKLTLGFSSCPNDTYIFDAMVHQKIDTEGLEFDPVLADVEALNEMAFQQKLNITKLSYHAFGYLIDQYVLLDAGSALGNNVGPLLIAKREMMPEEITNARIAIPGKYTTANFLLSLAYPNAKNKTAILFSEIENQVVNGNFDAGLIIHENRFTYQEKGLVKIKDLGNFWEDNYKLPIPLGGIVANRNLPKEIIEKINRVMTKSVQYAFDNPDGTLRYVRQHAQAMETEVMYKHIELYVNDYTKDLGKKGRNAIQQLFQTAQQKNIIPAYTSKIFLN